MAFTTPVTRPGSEAAYTAPIARAGPGRLPARAFPHLGDAGQRALLLCQEARALLPQLLLAAPHFSGRAILLPLRLERLLLLLRTGAGMLTGVCKRLLNGLATSWTAGGTHDMWLIN